MLIRLRATWLAAGTAFVVVLALTGAVAGAAFVLTASPTTAPTVTADTTGTFTDADGNNVDDSCQSGTVTPDATAAAAAEAAVDLNHDGTISVSEAARSARTGGKNCNHGGYVSQVAQEDPSTDETTDQPTTCDTGTGSTGDTTTTTTTDTTTTDTTTTTTDVAPNAHGKAVSAVAQSTAVGGKNCNHGGAVSEAAKNNKGHSQDAKDKGKGKNKHRQGGPD